MVNLNTGYETATGRSGQNELRGKAEGALRQNMEEAVKDRLKEASSELTRLAKTMADSASKSGFVSLSANDKTRSVAGAVDRILPQVGQGLSPEVLSQVRGQIIDEINHALKETYSSLDASGAKKLRSNPVNSSPVSLAGGSRSSLSSQALSGEDAFAIPLGQLNSGPSGLGQPLSTQTENPLAQRSPVAQSLKKPLHVDEIIAGMAAGATTKNQAQLHAISNALDPLRSSNGVLAVSTSAALAPEGASLGQKSGRAAPFSPLAEYPVIQAGSFHAHLKNTLSLS